MMWGKLVLQLVLLAVEYLQSKQLLEAGEAKVVNELLTRAKERSDVAKKVADSAGNLDDGWLQPGKNKPAGRVLPTDDVHRNT